MSEYVIGRAPFATGDFIVRQISVTSFLFICAIPVIDYIEKSSRGGKVTLTEQGRADSLSDFPNKAQKHAIREYWDHTKALREAKSGSNNANDQTSLDGNDDESTDDAQDVTDTWKTELLASLKKFSPTKFERFSRLLIS